MANFLDRLENMGVLTSLVAERFAENKDYIGTIESFTYEHQETFDRKKNQTVQIAVIYFKFKEYSLPLRIKLKTLQNQKAIISALPEDDSDWVGHRLGFKREQVKTDKIHNVIRIIPQNKGVGSLDSLSIPIGTKVNVKGKTTKKGIVTDNTGKKYSVEVEISGKPRIIQVAAKNVSIDQTEKGVEGSNPEEMTKEQAEAEIMAQDQREAHRKRMEFIKFIEDHGPDHIDEYQEWIESAGDLVEIDLEQLEGIYTQVKVRVESAKLTDEEKADREAAALP